MPDKRRKKRPNLLDEKDFRREKIKTRSGKEFDVLVAPDVDDAADVMGIFYARLLESMCDTINKVDAKDDNFDLVEVAVEIQGDLEFEKREGFLIFKFTHKDDAVRLGSRLRGKFVKTKGSFHKPDKL